MHKRRYCFEIEDLMLASYAPAQNNRETCLPFVWDKHCHHQTVYRGKIVCYAPYYESAHGSAAGENVKLSTA
eukprot:1386290-Amorphochlora_amoeboformis.AAC.3